MIKLILWLVISGNLMVWIRSDKSALLGTHEGCPYGLCCMLRRFGAWIPAFAGMTNRGLRGCCHVCFGCWGVFGMSICFLTHRQVGGLVISRFIGGWGVFLCDFGHPRGVPLRGMLTGFHFGGALGSLPVLSTSHQ